MAGLEKRGGRYNIIFRFGGQRFVRSLGTTIEKEAEELKERIERRIRLVKAGDIELPVGADIPTFLLSDGKLTKKPVLLPTLTLSQLFKEFFTSLPEGNLEDTTLYCMNLHRRHFERIIGVTFNVQQLTTEKLQSYVTKRSKEKGRRGGTVGPPVP